MGNGIEKYVMPIRNKVKRETTEKKELYNRRKASECSAKKESYKYQGILEENTIKQTEIKNKVKKKYFRRTKLLESKLYSVNVIKGINTGAFFIVKWPGFFVN